MTKTVRLKTHGNLKEIIRGFLIICDDGHQIFISDDDMRTIKEKSKNDV